MAEARTARRVLLNNEEITLLLALLLRSYLTVSG